MLALKAWMFAAILAAVSAVSGYGVWQVQEGRFARKEVQRMKDEAEIAKFNQAAANISATKFEDKRGKNEIRYKTVIEKVVKLVDRPVYIQQCIDDDGLRLLNDQIRRNTDPGKP